MIEMPARPWQPVYTLDDFRAALVRQCRLVIVCFVVLSAAVVAALYMAPKVYQSELKILVKRDRVDSLVSATPGGDGVFRPEVSEPELLSEVELMQGHDLLEQVALETRLAERTPSAAGARDATESLALTVNALRSDLTVAPIKKTFMIDVTYVSPDPQLAKNVLDTLARLYLVKHLAVRRPPGAYDFFSEQSTQSAEELRLAQAQLQGFGERHGVVSAAAEKEIVLQKLAEFEAAYEQARNALAETAQRVVALEAERARTPGRQMSTQRSGDSAGLIQEMQSRMLNLELKRTELLQKYTPQYRLVVEIDQQLEQVRGALSQARDATVKDETTEVNPTMQWVENEIARGRSEHSALTARVKSLSATVTDYRARAQSLDTEDGEQKSLLRTLKSAEDKYLLYQRKQEEARISDALDHTRIANVAIAQAPTLPFQPRRTRSLALLPLGLIAALGLSVMAGLMKDCLSTAIRTPDELHTLLDVPVFSVPSTRG